MNDTDCPPSRFIIGTGRCGSTLLARMLAQCPGLLVLDEVFAGVDSTSTFTAGSISGERFTEGLLCDRALIEFIRSRYSLLVEAGAPVLAEHADGLPGLLFLSGNEAIPPLCVWIEAAARKMGLDRSLLATRAMRFLKGAPARRPGEHFLTFFDWLAKQSRSERGWCERSGPSLELFREMAEAFPNGRFLHLHRDGVHTALSMHAHPLFALMVSLLNHPMSLEEARRATAAPVDGWLDPIVQRMTVEAPSIVDCGRYWSSVVANGMQTAMQLSEDRYLGIKFEDLVHDPGHTLDTIADFFCLGNDRAWFRDAAALVDNRRPVKRLPSLKPDELAALDAACEAGQRLLGRAKDAFAQEQRG